MNAKLAILISMRHDVSEDHQSDDYRRLVREVFPLISSCAHRGLRRTGVVGFVNDNQFKMLRDLGYVVRHENGLKMTTIEWCMQTAIEGGKAVYITPEEHNRRIDEYQAKLRGSVSESTATECAPPAEPAPLGPTLVSP